MLKVLKVTFYFEVYYNCHSLLKSFMHLSKVNFSDRYNDAKTKLILTFFLQKDCKYAISLPTYMLESVFLTLPYTFNFFDKFYSRISHFQNFEVPVIF